MRYLLALIFVMLGFSQNAAASPDGASLLRACNASNKQEDGIEVSDEEAAYALWCSGYVAGYLDGFQISSSTKGAGEKLCLPNAGITNDQAIRVITRWLKDHPETLHQSGRVEILRALASAFPCK